MRRALALALLVMVACAHPRPCRWSCGRPGEPPLVVVDRPGPCPDAAAYEAWSAAVCGPMATRRP